jgi:hypothetical protein
MRRRLSLLRPTKSIVLVRWSPALHVNVNVYSRRCKGTDRSIEASERIDTQPELIASSTIHIAESPEATISVYLYRDTEAPCEVYDVSSSYSSVRLSSRVTLESISTVLIAKESGVAIERPIDRSPVSIEQSNLTKEVIGMVSSDRTCTCCST